MSWDQIFLLVYLVLFYGIAFFRRSWIVWKRTGVNPYRLAPGPGIHGFLARGYRLVFVVVALIVLLYVFVEPAREWMGPLTWFERLPVQLAGAVLMAASLLWVLVAQTQMGASWRIGIDGARATALVRHGLFARSRNPIFLAMRLELLGLFLVLPGVAAAAVLVAGEILMQVQVRLEEQHLAAQHGAAYADYCARVRRWL